MLIFHPDQYDEWLDAPAARSMEFMRQYPAHMLISTPEPDRGKRKRADSGDSSA
jgi:putative SOS response-associated peptidase YedK